MKVGKNYSKIAKLKYLDPFSTEKFSFVQLKRIPYNVGDSFLFAPEKVFNT